MQDTHVNHPSKAHKVTTADTASSRRNPNCKPKASDFSQEFHTSILLACKYYQVLIATETSFPTKLEQDRLAREAWELANREYDVSLIASSDVYHVVHALVIHIHTLFSHNVHALVLDPSTWKSVTGQAETCCATFCD